MNFSSYVWIDNSYGPKLTLVDKGHDHGSWEQEPPDTVAEGGACIFRLQDNTGPFGSDGWVKYRSDDGAEFYMAFACPTGDNQNSFQMTCTGGTCDQYITAAYIESGCTPVIDGLSILYVGCTPYTGEPAKEAGHPIVATFKAIEKSKWPYPPPA